MTVSLDGTDLRDAWLDSDPSARWRLSVLLSESTGNEKSSVIYFELDPGCRLPFHVDSAEEIVLLVDGEAVAVVDDDEVVVPPTGVITIPEGVRHGIRNDGSRVVRAVAYFATAHPVSTFEEPVMPGGVAVRGATR